MVSTPSVLNVAFIVGDKSQDLGSASGFTSCVTLIVCVVTPVPLTVIDAVSGLVVVLAAAVTVIVPLLLPDAGDTVSQDALPLSTVQFVLEVILNVFCSPSKTKLSEDSETVKVGVEVPAICMTLSVFAVTPVPLTVIVAVRWLVVVLAAAVTAIVALLLPDAGDTVSQAASPLSTVQFVLDEILNVFCSPAAI